MCAEINGEANHDEPYPTRIKYEGRGKCTMERKRWAVDFSKWLAGHKSYFVCGKLHRAKNYHRKENVEGAIEKPRESYPSAMFSMYKLKLIVNDVANDQDEFE